MDTTKLFSEIFDAMVHEVEVISDPIIEFIESQVELDDEANRILTENFWDLLA